MVLTNGRFDVKRGHKVHKINPRAEALWFIAQNTRNPNFKTVVNWVNQAMRARAFNDVIVMLMEDAGIYDVRIKPLIHPFYNFNQPFSPEMQGLS
jgi:hypothetical protein